MNVIARSIRPPPSPERARIRAEAAIRRRERERIGQELHDSTSQLLVALQLNLTCLKLSSETAQNRQLFCDLNQTIEQLHREVRAVSTSDETPLLQEILPLALAAMATRFGLLSDIRVTLELPENYVSQAAEVEMSLYRIAQEALANVARHAHATAVKVQLACDRMGTLKLAIEDDGVGFGSWKEFYPCGDGTGIGNIRRRVHDMGGRLMLRRLRHGSQVAVTIQA